MGGGAALAGILTSNTSYVCMFNTGGEGADAAIDCVGGETIGQIISALRPGGRILSFGSLSGANVKMQVGSEQEIGQQ